MTKSWSFGFLASRIAIFCRLTSPDSYLIDCFHSNFSFTTFDASLIAPVCSRINRINWIFINVFDPRIRSKKISNRVFFWKKTFYASHSWLLNPFEWKRKKKKIKQTHSIYKLASPLGKIKKIYIFASSSERIMIANDHPIIWHVKNPQLQFPLEIHSRPAPGIPAEDPDAFLEIHPKTSIDRRIFIAWF